MIFYRFKVQERIRILNKLPAYYVETILNDDGWEPLSNIKKGMKDQTYLYKHDKWDIGEERFFYFSLSNQSNLDDRNKLINFAAFIEDDLYVFIGNGHSGFYRFIDGVFVKIERYPFVSSLDNANLKKRGDENRKALVQCYLE